MGPAIGMEKIKPASRPATDMVKILSGINPGVFKEILMIVNI
jgi:hypothetical protein